LQRLLDRWRCYLYNNTTLYRAMIIDVSQQLKEPVGSYRHYRISESDASPIYGEVDLLRTDRGIFVSGTLNTTHKAVCSRCLSSFEQPLTLRIEEEYLSKAEEGAFTIGEHKEIDLSEAVRQYALLVLPMKPLCSEDCAGLCHRCGHNLNLGPCDCPTSDLDPRFDLFQLHSCRGHQGDIEKIPILSNEGLYRARKRQGKDSFFRSQPSSFFNGVLKVELGSL